MSLARGPTRSRGVAAPPEQPDELALLDRLVALIQHLDPLDHHTAIGAGGLAELSHLVHGADRGCRRAVRAAAGAR
jgi:hypothetical protein